MSITIFTNGELLCEDDLINFIKKNNLNLKIQILANSNEAYKTITNKSFVFDKIYNNIKQLNKNSIPYTLELLVAKFNEDIIEDIYSKFNGKKINLEYIYPIKNNFSSIKYRDVMYNKNDYIAKVTNSIFQYTSKFNVCYKGTLAISCDGFVYPCIMSRKLLLGNIYDNKLQDIISMKKYKEYEKLNKDKVEGCNKCSFRYGCFECRALEMEATGKETGIKFCSLIKD